MKRHGFDLDRSASGKVAAGLSVAALALLTAIGCGEDNSKRLFNGATAPAGLEFQGPKVIDFPGSNGEVHIVKIFVEFPVGSDPSKLLSETDCGYDIHNKAPYTNDMGRHGVTCLEYVATSAVANTMQDAAQVVPAG